MTTTMKISIPRSEDVGIDTVTLRLPYSTSYFQTITSDGEVRPGASHSISLKGRMGSIPSKLGIFQARKSSRLKEPPTGTYMDRICSQIRTYMRHVHACCMSTDNRLACALTTNSLASASVDRVDLFINLRFEDNHEAAKVLKQLGLQFAAQQKSVSVYATSAYWNPGKEKSYQVICYAKGLQLQAKRQRMRTKNEFLDKIVDEANGIVRIELRYVNQNWKSLGDILNNLGCQHTAQAFPEVLRTVAHLQRDLGVH